MSDDLLTRKDNAERKVRTFSAEAERCEGAGLPLAAEQNRAAARRWAIIAANITERIVNDD